MTEETPGQGLVEPRLVPHGRYEMVCTDSDGNILWEQEIENLITTLGKNMMWNETLTGSAYTVVGPYMGLISSASFSAVAIGDTMSSHAGWLEANATNAPPYGTTRPTVTYNAASGGAIVSNAATFVFTNGGTIQGAFQVTGAAATASNTGTVGTLFSAGTLAVPQPVVSTNTVTVTWTGTLT